MNSNDTDEEKRIIEFSNRVIEAFNFLEEEYEYIRKELEREDFDYPVEKKVVIRFFSQKIAVEVIWYIGNCDIAIGLYELQNGKIPENVSVYGHKGYGRAINLDSLVRMLTDGQVKSPIPHSVHKADEIIRKNMKIILGTFAERLKKYATNILKGDTSIFPKVQEYHRKYWEVEI